MKTNALLPVIGPERNFYGFLTGLWIEPACDNTAEKGPGTRYASFEHENKISVYRVLDYSLFNALTRHLSIMAYVRDWSGSFGKIWIEQLADGSWLVRD